MVDLKIFPFKYDIKILVTSLFFFVLIFNTIESKANGTVYYFDVNGSTAGFGSPSGSYNVSGSYWTTNSAGTSATTTIPGGSQFTFGSSSSDFAGNTFTINFDIDIDWQGLLINSTSANITFSGTSNAYLSSTQTWTIPSGSTFNMSLAYNGVGLNMNGSALTLSGGGTLNWTTAVGYNVNGSTTINQNGSGMVVNLQAAAGSASQASYTLTQGTLNFATAASANAFNKMLSGENAKFTIAGGTINNTSGSAITLSLNTGSYVLAGSFTFTGTNNLDFGTHSVALTSASTITTSANTLTIGGVVSGAFALGKSGSGTLTLSGTNTYTGATTINDGTLKAGSTSAFGSNSAFTLANVASAILDITGYSNTIGSITGGGTTGGNVTLGAATLTIGSDNTSPSEYAGVISGTGAIIKSGSGTLILSGSNTYTGLTTINAGTLKLGASGGATNTPLGTTAAGTVVAATGACLDLAGFTLGTAEALTLNGTGISSGGALMNSGAAATYSGLIALGSASSIIGGTGTIAISNSGTISGATFGLTLGGAQGGSIASIIGTTSGTLTKQDASTWTLSATNTYTGATTITAGTLLLQAGYSSVSYDISSGATLELYTTNANLDYGTTTTFSGAGTIKKTGSGTIVWGVATATFSLSSGALIDVQAGTFKGGSNANEVWTSNLSDLNIASGATFTGVEANVKVDALTGSGDLNSGYGGSGYTNFTFGVDNGSGDFTGIIANGSSTGNFVKSGTGTQTFSGANTYTGTTTISAGTLKLGASEVIPDGSAVTVNGTLDMNTYSETVGSIAGSGTIDNVLGGGTPVLTCGGANSNTTFSGVIQNTTGTLALTKTGSGTLTLTGASTNSGIITISAGTISFGNGSTTGSVTSTSIVNNGTLTVNRSNAISYSGVISGTGALTKSGAGTLTLSGTNTYSGNTTISSGVIQISNNAGLGSTSGSTSISTSGSLWLDGGITCSENFSTTGSGSGTSNDLSGSAYGAIKNYSGTNTLSGTITLATGGGSTLIEIADGTSLTISGGISTNSSTRSIYIRTLGTSTCTVSGVISNGTAVVPVEKYGTGTLILSGTNTYTGTTTVNAGILKLNNTAALGTNAAGTIVSSGAALDLNGITYSTTEALTISGTGVSSGGALINTGSSASFAGTVTMAADATINTANQITLSGTISPSTYSLTKEGTNSLVFTSNSVTVNALSISAGTLSAGSSTINIYGNFTNSGTFTCGTGTVAFNGAASQSIAAATFNNLTINNTTSPATSAATIAGAITVNGALTMTTGILNTSSYTITLGSSASISETNPSATAPTSYVIGTVTTTRDLLQNVTNTFGGIGVSITETTQVSNSTLVTRQTGTASVGVGNQSILRYFDITPNVDANLNGTMVFSYIDDELNGQNEVNFKLYKSSNAGSTWTKQASSSVNTGSNTLSLSSISSFSRWTASNTSTNPLPVEFVSFTATKETDATILKWETAQEINNDYFDIERSHDGINFEKITTIKGVGTTNSISNYSYLDKSTNKTLATYYRLKQVDFDNKTAYSSIVFVNGSIGHKEFHLYPNPLEEGNKLYACLGDDDEGIIKVSVFDMSGKLLQDFLIDNIETGSNITLKNENLLLPKGMYIIEIKSIHNDYKQKLDVK